MSETGDKKSSFLNSVKSVASKVAEKTASTAEGMKSTAVQLKDDALAKQAENKVLAAERKKQNDFDRLCPIFDSDLTPDSFQFERIIRVANYDARLENEVCEGSVGFYEKTATRRIPTIYSRFIGKLGFVFYPHLSESVFIADPCISGKYIEIDEYFNYMKQVRVNELTLIAQSLGAKHVDIRLKTAQKSSSNSNMGLSLSAGIKPWSVGAKGDRSQTSSSTEAVAIWASTDFDTAGWNGVPAAPPVLYFRNESDIQSLIQMATGSMSKITKRTYSLQASSSSGMSLSEAADINASIKCVKCKAGATFESHASSENDALLEYTIEF